MSYGQEIFRIKYKETMDSLNIIKNNYFDLDVQYQEEISKKDKEIERLNNIINEIEKYAGLGEVNWEDKYQDIMLSSKGLLKRIKELKGDSSNE